MPELLNSKENSGFYRLTEGSVLFLIGLYILLADLSKTTMNMCLPDHTERNLFLLIALAATIRLVAIYKIDSENRWYWCRYIISAIAISIIYYLSYTENRNKSAMFIAVITLASIGINYNRILKVYIASAVTAIFTAIIMAWTGAIENYVYIREYTVRSSWGIKYPTDLTSLLFFLLLALWIVFKKQKPLWFIIPGGLLFLLAWRITDSRTGIMCSMAFIAAVLVEPWLGRIASETIKKTIDCCLCAVFPVFTVIMNALVFARRAGKQWAIRMDGPMSGRLSQAAIALDEHGISLFGDHLRQVGMGGSTFERPDYSFVDISYTLILLSYGIVALIMINIIWILMTRKALQIGDNRLAIVMALIALNAASEHHIVQPNYNIFLAIPFAILAMRENSYPKEIL